MSLLFIDRKFARLLGARLLNFKEKKPDLFTFSHTCEDRSSSKVKARGYIYRQENSLYVKCHHCSLSHKLSTFLQQECPTLADEYRLETYKEKVNSGQLTPRVAERKEVVIPKISLDSVLDGLIALSTLPKSHPAVLYAKKRAIPEEHYKSIFFCPKFFKYAVKYKDSFAKMKEDYPRLVFPYFDANGRVYALTARAFGNEEPKYIFLSIDERKENIYGIWRIDASKPIIAVEGQIDSLCVDNAIAVGGADYNSVLLRSLQSNLIIVPDNDFIRNKQVADSVMKAIRAGYAVSLFPASFKYKDINEATKKMTKQEIQTIILDNVKRGAEAELELIFRRKC
jgi:hypothetical protein